VQHLLCLGQQLRIAIIPSTGGLGGYRQGLNQLLFPFSAEKKSQVLAFVIFPLRQLCAPAFVVLRASFREL
jgi:hypothetical protein